MKRGDDIGERQPFAAVPDVHKLLEPHILGKAAQGLGQVPKTSIVTARVWISGAQCGLVCQISECPIPAENGGCFRARHGGLAAWSLFYTLVVPFGAAGDSQGEHEKKGKAEQEGYLHGFPGSAMIAMIRKRGGKSKERRNISPQGHV
jgi:hypothetical protein